MKQLEIAFAREVMVENRKGRIVTPTSTTYIYCKFVFVERT